MSAGANLYPNADPLARALGFNNWRGVPTAFTAAAALANQEVDVVAIWLPFGVPVGNVVLSVSTAGVGVVPTGFFVGIGNATKMLAQSGNLAASASLTTLGQQKFALAASYTPVPNDSPAGLFYVVILQNGAFGTTNVQFSRQGLIGGAGATPAAGIAIQAGRAGTVQAALPANGAAYATAIGTGGGQEWWAATTP